MINYKIHYTGEKIDELLDIVNGNINIKAIRTDAQQLSDSQKAQARQNIGAIDETRAGEIDEEVKETQELLAPVQETYIASKDYSIGEFLVLENKLYKVVDDIDSGETIVVDGNVVEASIGNEIVGINERIDNVEDAILAKREESAVATKNYLVGELLILEDVLYRVTANIASGEAIVVGTNVVATSVAEELAALDEKKANTSGVYDGLTSGQSKQLMATVGTEDKEPYLFRSSGGSIDVGDRKEEEFVGGTVAWNQLVQNGNFTDTSGWSIPAAATITVNNGTATISNQVSTYTRIQRSSNSTAYANHKYLIMLKAASSTGKITILPTGATTGGVFYFTNVTEETPIAVIWVPLENYTTLMWHVRFNVTTQGESELITATIRDYCAYDLTQMFGTSIADYVYSLETSTPGAGVAWFRKLFPKAYYPYDTGTLRSVQFSAHETIGFNAFNPSTGTAKLLGGNQYQISGTYTSLAYENLDGKSETITPDGNGYFTPEKNGILTVTGGNGSDTCVHLVWSGYRDGEWEAFEKHQYEVEEVELRGIPKIDGNGSLYWDGDRYKSDGVVERRYRTVIYNGSENWDSYNGAFYKTLNGYKKYKDSTLMAVSNEFICTTQNGGISALIGKGRGHFAFRNDNVNMIQFYPIDETITTASQFKAWLSNNPITVVYELATPTTETASPYTNSQIINDFGTEEFLDTREVPIPVGHETFYAVNLRDKLQHLPDLAPSNGKYLVSQNGTQMELVAPQTDSTLSLEGEFADAKATGDAINETREMIAERETSTTATKNYSVGDLVIVSDTLYRVMAAIATGETITEGTNVTADTIADELDVLDEEKADKVGEAPDLTAGNARQLLPTVGITEQVPYNFRTSGGSLEIGDRETDEIVGGTVVWNQIVKNGNFVDKSNWDASGTGVTWEVQNNTAILHYSVTSATGMKRIGRLFNFIQGHQYLISFDARSTLQHDINSYAGPSGSTIGSYQSSLDGSTNYITVARITKAKATASSTFVIGTRATISEAFDLYLKNVIIIDLTQMFGTTIADYVYSLEQSTPGAGVSWFRRLFPNNYYAFDPGTLRSVKTSAHRMIGFNQWDEEWESGSYSSTTGQKMVDDTRIRCKNKIRILPSTTYYFKASHTIGLRYYDANGNYIASANDSVNNSTKTTPSNAYYMAFSVTNETSYHNDICINFHYDGERDGEYAPYEAHTYALDPIELRGIPNLDTNNNLYYDGDRYKSDGTVERNYGIVDLGTLTWERVASTQLSDVYYFRAVLSGFKYPQKGVCSKYPHTPSNQSGQTGLTENKVWNNSAYALLIRDDDYTDVATFASAMSGVSFVYELATPTTETAAPYTNPQIVSNWGTEEYIDADVASGDRDVAIPVGHVTEYLQDLRSKVETAPNSPDADGTYLVRRENGENSYVLFSEPEAQKALSEIEILAQIADGVYQGVDLTTKFASEISGDPWAWIQGRIQSGDFSGIHVNDWIPFTTTESTPRTYKACVGGINMYKNYGDTAVGNHIDFICQELWYTRHPINPIVFNNGTKFGDAAATEYPWLASDLYLWLNSLAGKVANAATVGGGTGTDVDYTSDGVYYYLPTALKNVIVEKRAYLPKRYSASGLLSDDNAGGWENIGKLWLPSEFEVYGARVWGGNKGGYATMGNCVQYPIFAHNMNRVKGRSGSRDNWWVLSAYSGFSTYWCIVNAAGSAHYYPASSTAVAAPICFRIS